MFQKARKGSNGRIIRVKNVYKVKKSCRDDVSSYIAMLNSLKEQKIKNAVKANLLEKPALPVKHVYIEVILDHLASNEEKEEILHSINTFDMSSIL